MQTSIFINFVCLFGIKSQFGYFGIEGKEKRKEKKKGRKKGRVYAMKKEENKNRHIISRQGLLTGKLDSSFPSFLEGHVY